MDVAALITKEQDRLTPAERRVADIVLQHPQLVAFGTVADLAAAARASGATVVRLATKLGFDGFTSLQGEVQADLARRLRPAAERIREPGPPDVVGRTLSSELDNVQATLEAIDREAFGRAVDALADEGRRVFVLSGEASRGVAHQFAYELAMLRADVHTLGGSPVQLVRTLAEARPGDTCLVIDLRRYERWVVDAAKRASARGATLVALTDSALSPLAQSASATFVVAATGGGPFDSHVGTLALANALATAVAARLRTSATERLDRIEAAWREADALVDP